MNENSYRDHVKALQDATKSVAKESMGKGADEPTEDGLYDSAVSGDGTWRKRGFSSLCSSDSNVHNIKQASLLIVRWCPNNAEVVSSGKEKREHQSFMSIS